MLNNFGLRPTRQRIALASLLLARGHRRVTGEALYEEARQARCSVSRATACVVLRQFEQAGLLKRISIPGSKKAWFAVHYRIIDLFA